MDQLPYRPGGDNPQPVYHVIPDPVQGGWNVYDTHRPQEPQAHFDSKQEAVIYAERKSVREGVGYVVEEHEAPRAGR